MSYITTKIPTNETMPHGRILRLKLLLNGTGYVLFSGKICDCILSLQNGTNEYFPCRTGGRVIIISSKNNKWEN